MTDILGQDIMYAPGVGPKRKEMLKKELGIETFGQLLEHYPYKYIDRRHVYRISELMESMSFVQVKGHILGFETFDTGRRNKRLHGGLQRQGALAHQAGLRLQGLQVLPAQDIRPPVNRHPQAALGGSHE